MTKEVDILKTMDHPNIVRFYGSFYDSKSIHILMEHLKGGDLL